MATNANLPAGFTITSMNGKRCTQVPRSLTTIAGEMSFATTTSTSSSTTSSAQETTTSEPPPTSTTSTASTSSTQAQGNLPSIAAAIASTSPSTVPVVSSSIVSITSSTSSPIISSTSPSTISSTIVPIISTPSTVPTSLIVTSTPEPEITTSSTPPLPAAATTTSSPPVAQSLTPAVISSTSEGKTTSASETPTSASPTSKGTTPTIFSSTSIPILQSEVSATPMSTGLFNDVPAATTSSRSTSTVKSSPIISVTTSAPVEESSAAGGISSNPKLAAAPVVGGVMGGIALVGLIGLIFWLFRRRRRNSLLTPLGTGTQEKFYEIDRDSISPTKPLTRWEATLGYQGEKLRDAVGNFTDSVTGLASSLKSKVSGGRRVNLNRGNSQFLDGPIPQHSRNNSSFSSHNGKPSTTKDRLEDWLSIAMSRGKKDRQSQDHYASARSGSKKQAKLKQRPDYSQLLDVEQRDLQAQAERRRSSLSRSYLGGGLGLDFAAKGNQQSDPLADPAPKSSTTPFANFITAPPPSIPKQNTYISDIRRSRGLSMDTTITGAQPPKSYAPNFHKPSSSISSAYPNPPKHTKNPSYAPASRYPSTVAPSRDSYRDTIFTSLTSSSIGRKGRRSDPFDLERSYFPTPVPPLPVPTPMPEPTESTVGLYPDPLRTEPDHSAAFSLAGVGPVGAGTSTAGGGSRGTRRVGNKYSSGTGSLGGWGDPGPVVMPGSVGSSFHTDGRNKVYNSGQALQGSLTEMSPRRDGDAASIETVSSRGGVGKAK